MAFNANSQAQNWGVCLDPSCASTAPRVYNQTQDGVTNQASLTAMAAGIGTVNTYITTSQTYAVPSDTTTASVWYLRCAGGGGSGGGGQTLNQSPGGGGAACVDVTMTGLGPTGSISITLGAGGAAVTGSNAGNPGGSTTVVIGSDTFVAGGGGAGGNTTTAAAGKGGVTSGCSSPKCFPLGGEGGGVTGSGPGGYGGSSCFGGASRETQAGQSGDSGNSPGAGGAGGGNGGNNSSGAGAKGACILRRLN